MKRTFTKLTAALALLTFLAVPMGMWGQTRAEGDTHDFSQTLQQLLNNNASISSINIAEQSYAVKKVTISYRYNKDIENAVTMAVTVGGVSWGTQYSTETGSDYTTIDFEGTSTTGNIDISFTNNTGNGTGHGTFYVNNVRLTEGSSATITSLSYTGAPNKTEYDVGESFDPTGLTVTATYSDASTQDVTSSVVWTPNPLTQGTTYVTGTYSGQSVLINGITVTGPNIVLDKNNKPYTSTSSSNTNVVTTTLDGIEYQSYAGYIYNNYLSFNRSESGAYLGNNTQLCGNIKKIVVDYYQGGSSYFTMYEGTSALAETTTVSPSSTGTGKVTYTFSGNNGYFKFKLTTTGTFCNINSISIYLNDCSIYHVTYNANGATSGDVPTDATEYDEDNNTVTVFGPGNLAKTGHAFSGWNTAADGSGTSYNEGATFVITENTTLYAQWTAYTINAQSNNTSYGTVSLDGFTITASPAAGCRYASPAYTVSPANSATVTQNGNEFTVAPTENTTVTINFEEIPTHDAIFSVNGTTTSTQVAEGAAITFPANPADTGGKTFVGWTTTTIDGTTDEAPTMVNSATMGNSNVTFYAVFATVVDGGSGSYTLDYNQESGLSSATLGYGSPVEYTATDGSTWIVKAHKNAGMQINTGKNSSIKVPNCPGDITSIEITCSAAKAVGFSENDYNGSGTITYLASGTDATSQTLDLTGKSATTGYIVPKSGSTSITKIVVNYASVSISGYCTTVAAATDPTIVIVPSTVDATAAGNQGILNVTYNNIDSENGVEIHWFDAAGQRVQGGYDWVSATLDGNWNVNYSINANSGAARTAYLKIYGLDEEANGVYSNLVTISQAEYVAPSNWELTDLADLTPADVFVIVGDNGDTYALSNDNGTSSAPDAVEVTVVDGTLSGEIAANIQWNISGNATDGYTFYPAGSATTWLYCTNTNNGVRVGTNSNNKVFKYVDGGTVGGVQQDYYLQNVATNRYVGIYNSQDWRCYESINDNIKNQSFSFYKKVSDPIICSKQIAKYEGDGGYYLIASPVASVTPSTENGFLNGTPGAGNNTYDLYYFDQSQLQEWCNYETQPFNLVSGKGYLYANGETNGTKLTFTGQPYNGNGLIALDYDEDAEFAGWNLIGNPFNTNATLNKPYYRLNDDGSGLSTTTENTAVNVMEGVFVQATAANTEAVFTQASSGAKSISQLNVKVTRNRSAVLDNAIIRFDNGAVLGKFQLNPNSTKLYITEGNQDFAVVRSNNEGEMPVSFKAETRGTYTLAVEAENVEMTYLHLFDNKTGADVDLLATPSYTFEASNDDYESRFRLVFKANADVEENAATETFAYFNGSEWVINNPSTGSGDNATLQVVDMMGRVLSSETINGNANVTLNQASGIYMLRLINGENVMVQKVVVR